MKEFKVTKEEKLSKITLREYDGKISYSSFMKLLREKDIKVNGKRVKEDVLLKEGDIVNVYYEVNYSPLNVVFKNDDILVINKGDNEEFYSLEDRVKKEYEEVYSIHRLDRNTTGLIVFALNQQSEKELLKAFKDRSIEKYYVAILKGKIVGKDVLLEGYLKKDDKTSSVKIFNKEVAGSERIQTKYSLIKYDKERDLSIVEIDLLTGKTHQIRAHMAYIGNPVLGDNKYGDVELNKMMKLKHQCLKAYKIVFHFNKNEHLYYLNEKEIYIGDSFDYLNF